MDGRGTAGRGAGCPQEAPAQSRAAAPPGVDRKVRGLRTSIRSRNATFIPTGTTSSVTAFAWIRRISARCSSMIARSTLERRGSCRLRLASEPATGPSHPSPPPPWRCGQSRAPHASGAGSGPRGGGRCHASRATGRWRGYGHTLAVVPSIEWFPFRTRILRRLHREKLLSNLQHWK